LTGLEARRYNRDMDDSELELEELADQVREVGKLTPREYAKLRGHNAQLVYYYIRQKQLELEYCICGRKVLDVKLTDEFFDSRKK
jgi:hypothetical protein